MRRQTKAIDLQRLALSPFAPPSSLPACLRASLSRVSPTHICARMPLIHPNPSWSSHLSATTCTETRMYARMHAEASSRHSSTDEQRQHGAWFRCLPLRVSTARCVECACRLFPHCSLAAAPRSPRWWRVDMPAPVAAPPIAGCPRSGGWSGSWRRSLESGPADGRRRRGTRGEARRGQQSRAEKSRAGVRAVQSSPGASGWMEQSRVAATGGEKAKVAGNRPNQSNR